MVARGLGTAEAFSLSGEKPKPGKDKTGPAEECAPA